MKFILIITISLFFSSTINAAPGGGKGGGKAQMGGNFPQQHQRIDKKQERQEQHLRDRMHQDQGKGELMRHQREEQNRQRTEPPGYERREQNSENIRQRTDGKARGDVPGAQKRWWWPFGE